MTDLRARHVDRAVTVMEPRYRDIPRSMKAAVLAYRLSRGDRLSTYDIQVLFDYDTWHGAYWLVTTLSGAIPIVKEDRYGGRWYLLMQGQKDHDG